MTEFVEGNRIGLVRSGLEYFPELIAQFDAARREIHLETYIFEDDATGRAIAQALARAARRGVATHVMVDGFGSQGLDRALVSEMTDAGVEFLVYRRQISPWTLRRTRLRRLHRKIVLIDDRIAFVGGINIMDEVHEPDGRVLPRFDYAVRVEGPLVAEIQRVVKRLWNRVVAYTVQAYVPKAGGPLPQEKRGAQRAAFVVRDNIGHRRDIEEAYLEAIGRARTEILIANAYFLPGLAFRRALFNAARRGVRVTLLLQGKVEYILQHYATRALYGSLLDAGVEIHEYHKSFMHAKVAVIDRHWSTVGSSNIDPFSLLLAREANVVIEDEAFAWDLRSNLMIAIAEGATQIGRERWEDQPPLKRMVTWCCYELVRFLAGTFAYGRGREMTG
jgi:cardiolipin synthase A/B